jgi:DNA polymerase I-like protein with 3'-5' exonuclease and polymerase domains
MTILVFDTETTISNKGNPFDKQNKLCYYGDNHGLILGIEYEDTPYVDKLKQIQNNFDNASLIVGFNLKFDLHWVRNYGISFKNKRLWDCQLVHFILTGQQHTYPSLNEVAEYYGLEQKLDVVAEEYWNNKIDTPNIPKNILESYLKQDVKLTEQIYYKQVEDIQKSPHLKVLISLHNQDLLVLEEMEYNGLLFNEERSIELGAKLSDDLSNLDSVLYSYHNLDEFNPNSTDHLSAFLYGGTINLSRKVPNGTYKTGLKAGQPKEKWEDYSVQFDQIVRPLKGSELKKEGLYSTDEQTLRNLRGNKKAKEIIEILLTRAEYEKRVSTYYYGLPKLRKEMNWDDGHIYGQLNQCVARTGRLSSSRPNLQNFDGEIKELFYSRFS